MTKDPYEILGVAPGADPEEIKKAYRRRTKECHPDLHPDDPSAGERMAQVNAAYDMLQNPEKYAEEQRREQAQRAYSRQQQSYQQYSQGNGYTYYTYTYRDPFEGFESEDEPDGFYGFRRSPVTFHVFPIFGILRWIFYFNAIGWIIRFFLGLFAR